MAHQLNELIISPYISKRTCKSSLTAKTCPVGAKFGPIHKSCWNCPICRQLIRHSAYNHLMRCLQLFAASYFPRNEFFDQHQGRPYETLALVSDGERAVSDLSAIAFFKQNPHFRDAVSAALVVFLLHLGAPCAGIHDKCCWADRSASTLSAADPRDLRRRR